MNWLKRFLDGLVFRVRWNLWRVNVQKLWTDLETIPVDRPIFLLGTQGGGLTLISRVLRRHPSAVCVTGGSSYWVGGDEMQNVLADALPDSLRLRGHPVLERRQLQESWLYATDRLLPHFRQTEEDASEEIAQVLLERLREILLLFGDRGLGRRFIDKSQTYTVKVSFLARLLERHDPKFLLVTRNPYALCHRAAERVLTDIDEPRSRCRRLAAEHWCNSMRCALEDGSKIDGFGIVRFEDFLSQPELTLAEIGETVEMELSPELLPGPDDWMPLGKADEGEKWYPLRSDVNEKYLKEIPEEVTRIVDDQCGAFVDRFGYSPEGP